MNRSPAARPRGPPLRRCARGGLRFRGRASRLDRMGPLLQGREPRPQRFVSHPLHLNEAPGFSEAYARRSILGVYRVGLHKLDRGDGLIPGLACRMRLAWLAAAVVRPLRCQRDSGMYTKRSMSPRLVTCGVAASRPCPGFVRCHHRSCKRSYAGASRQAEGRRSNSRLAARLNAAPVDRMEAFASEDSHGLRLQYPGDRLSAWRLHGRLVAQKGAGSASAAPRRSVAGRRCADPPRALAPVCPAASIRPPCSETSSASSHPSRPPMTTRRTGRGW